MAKSLQAQGVPIPSKLNGPTAPGVRNNAQTPSGIRTSPGRSGTPKRAPSGNAKSVSPRKSRGSSLSSANPARLGAKASGSVDTGGTGNSGGVALLEAEFLIAAFLLVMLMFANTDSTVADKIMGTMKRGTLICAVFFVLALIAGIGPHASKFSKAFGALVIVAIVVTAPVGTVLTDLDNIVKNDWVGTDEKGDDVSADSGTGASTTPAAPSEATVLKDIEGVINKVNPLGTGSPVGTAASDLAGKIWSGLKGLF